MILCGEYFLIILVVPISQIHLNLDACISSKLFPVCNVEWCIKNLKVIGLVKHWTPDGNSLIFIEGISTIVELYSIAVS